MIVTYDLQPAKDNHMKYPTPSQVVKWCIDEYGMDADDIRIFAELLDIAVDTNTPEIDTAGMDDEGVRALLFEVMDQALHYVIIDYLDVRADGSLPEAIKTSGEWVRWGCRQLLRNSEFRGYDEEYYGNLRHLLPGDAAVDDIVLDWLDATTPALTPDLKPNPYADIIRKTKALRSEGLMLSDIRKYL